MKKRSHDMIARAAETAAMALHLQPRDDAFSAIECRAKKLVDSANSISEERADSIVGIRIDSRGRIVDVVASNGAVRIEG